MNTQSVHYLPANFIFLPSPFTVVGVDYTGTGNRIEQITVRLAGGQEIHRQARSEDVFAVRYGHPIHMPDRPAGYIVSNRPNEDGSFIQPSNLVR